MIEVYLVKRFDNVFEYTAYGYELKDNEPFMEISNQDLINVILEANAFIYELENDEIH